MSSGVFIIGNNNSVSPDVSGVVLINADGEVITSEHNGQTRFNNGALIVDEFGISSATIAVTKATKTGNFTAGVDAYNVYYVDATAIDLIVTLEVSNLVLWLVRTDATANTVTVTPQGGALINGAATYGLNTQYDNIIVTCDGTDFFYKDGGSGVSTFTSLTDVPNNYTGDSLKYVRVNAGETGLEFVTLAGGGDLLAANNLSDVVSAATSRTNLGIATTANQTDSLNKRFVTDAQLVVIGNTSGTNSGNETVNTLGATVNASAAATPNDADLVATVDTSVVKKITWTNVKAFLKTYFDTIYQAAGSYLTSANIVETITNGVTTNAPSENAVFDALALKAPLTSPTFATSVTGSYLTASEVLITDGSKNIVSAPVATYPSLTELTYVKGVTSAIQTQLGSKQDTLVSATNIKTVNSTTLLGAGDLAVQAVLVSATNIKTINGSSVLGAGDLIVSGSLPELVVTKNVSTANQTIAAGYSAYVPHIYEVANGFTTEISNTSFLEIG